jgi:hypothetical protein
MNPNPTQTHLNLSKSSQTHTTITNPIETLFIYIPTDVLAQEPGIVRCGVYPELQWAVPLQTVEIESQQQASDASSEELRTCEEESLVCNIAQCARNMMN